MAVYEHTPDQGCKETHVHMIMLGCNVKAEALKRKYYKMYPEAKTADGNGLWSWENKDWPVPDINFVTYMSKGVLAPKFVKNISPAELEELRGKWSEPTHQPSSQTIIKVKEEKLTNYVIMLKVVNLILAEHADKNEIQRKLILENLSDELWIKHIRKVLIQNHVMKATYKVVDIYECCKMYYSPSDFISDCLTIIQRKRKM